MVSPTYLFGEIMFLSAFILGQLHVAIRLANAYSNRFPSRRGYIFQMIPDSRSSKLANFQAKFVEQLVQLGRLWC